MRLASSKPYIHAPNAAATRYCRPDAGLDEQRLASSPVGEDILNDMRARLWIEGEGKWSDEEMRKKAAYGACMYGSEFASRVGVRGVGLGG